MSNTEPSSGNRTSAVHTSRVDVDTESAGDAPPQPVGIENGSYGPLIRAHPRVLGFGFLHAFTSGIGQTFFLSLFLPSVCAAFTMERTEFSTYYGLCTLASGLLLPFVGGIIDRISAARFSLLGTLALTAGLCLFAAAPNTLVFVVALFMVRFLGQGIMSHVNSACTSRYFERSRGRALALTLLGHPVGEAIFPAIIVASIMSIGWRQTAFCVAAFVGLVVGPLAHVLLKPFDTRPSAFISQKDKAEGDTTKTAASDGWSRREVLSSVGFYLIIPFWIMPGMLLTGYFFHQTTLSEEMGWTLEWYATSFVAFAVFRGLTSFLAGPIVDRFGARRLILVSLVPLIVGILLLAVFRGTWVAPAFLALSGALGFAGTVKGTFMADIFGTKNIGAIRSLMVTVAVIGTSICPPIFSLALDMGITFRTLSAFSVVLCLCSVALCALGLRRLERESEARG